MPRPFSFLHTGDLHLDTPFAGLAGSAPEAISARLRDATLRAWDRIVGLAIDRSVDFVVVAGDVFEAETRTLRGQLAFADGLERLSTHGIPAAVVTGNHDPLSGWEASVVWPGNARRFGPEVEAVPIVKDGQELARVYGISYAQKAETRDLAARFRRDPDAPFAIGLLHGTVGISDRHERYAPTTEETLVSSGMDYWALGHIHARRVVRPARPMVVYPGNPQGRDPGEASAKGVALVTVDADGRPVVDFADTDVIRWVVVSVDCTSLTTMTDLRSELRSALLRGRGAAGRSIVARIMLRGFTGLHDELRQRGVAEDLLRALREDHAVDADPFVWLESLHDETRSDLETAYARGGDFIAELDGLVEATLATLRASPTAADGSKRGAPHEPLALASIAAELYGDPRIRQAVDDAEQTPVPPLDQILDEARTTVLDRLRATGG